MKLAGSGVVVTGAGRGIGRAIAQRLAAEGARVVVNDLDAGAAAEVAAAVGGYAVAGDAASEAGVPALIRAARERLGRIDIYVANAGVERSGGLTTAEDDWALSLEVNLMAHVRAARELVPAWVASGGGRLVVTASAAGLLTLLGSPAYAASKHAAVAFAEWLSASFRHRGVVVQVICPQAVNTRMLQPSTPVGRLVAHDGVLEPEQVADAVLEAMGDDRFLILPHPSVLTYYGHRATQTDRWLEGMNVLQQRLE
jgi:NAD(P)-dependent dehydrogenase (short-subunit alcohol dehydrogenase family)